MPFTLRESVIAGYVALKLVGKFVVPAVIGYGALWVRRWRQRSRQGNAAGWQSVEGSVVSIKSAPIPKTMFHVVTLTYSYFVDEYRAGEYVHEFRREDDADDFARNMRDRRIQIRYKPSNPDVSVIDQSTIEQLAPVALRRS